MTKTLRERYAAACKVDADNYAQFGLRDTDTFKRLCEEMAAIIDKLAVTADGVPVVPGMKLYLPGYPQPGEVNEFVFTVNDCAVWPGADGENPNRIEQCYSTPEAALATEPPAVHIGRTPQGALDAAKALGGMPPADSPCDECGTVGGGGKIVGPDRRGRPGYVSMLPCPKCGEKGKSDD